VSNGRTSADRSPGFAPARAEIARARTADFTDFTERTTDADLRRARVARRGVRRVGLRDALDAAIVISSPYYRPLLLTSFNYFLRRSTIK
jgi:hypothetical protein